MEHIIAIFIIITYVLKNGHINIRETHLAGKLFTSITK